LAGVAVFVGAGLATAHEMSYPSTVTIRFYDAADPNSGASRCDDPTGHEDCFYGRVRSAQAACQRHRTVRVFDRNPTPPMRARADHAGTQPELVGKTRSDADGRWIVVVDNPGTHTFFARAARRTISRRGHAHRCRRAVSDDLTVKSDYG